MAARAIYQAKGFRSREALGALVGRTRKLIIEQLELELERHGVSAAQSIVVLVVAQGTARTAAEACKLLSHDPGAMTRLVDRLEAKGFMRRVRGRGDRRSVQLELTPRGRELYRRINAAQIAVYNRMLQGFSVGEARTLEALLRRVLENAGA